MSLKEKFQEECIKKSYEQYPIIMKKLETLFDNWLDLQTPHTTHPIIGHPIFSIRVPGSRVYLTLGCLPSSLVINLYRQLPEDTEKSKTLPFYSLNINSGIRGSEALCLSYIAEEIYQQKSYMEMYKDTDKEKYKDAQVIIRALEYIV